MQPSLLIAVAAGGAVGAVARYLAATWIAGWAGTGFPWGTLAINVAGSFAMGLLAEAAAYVWDPGPALRISLGVGVLGAFTTFSTFSLDTALLIERGAWAYAAAYAVISILLCIGGLFAGLHIVRAVAS